MLYAILCYDAEDAVHAWSKEKDAQVMCDLGAVVDGLAAQNRIGPVARLAGTKQATTIRKGTHARVVDGPFAETKEQLLGFYVVECATLEDARAVAQDLAKASGSEGAFELRPITYFRPGGTVA